MTKLNDAFTSTKQRLDDAQTSLVGTAVKSTVKVQRQSLEQWVAVARKHRIAPPTPTRVAAEARQYYADVAAIRKESVEELRSAWKPVYEAAAVKVTEVTERALLKGQAASAGSGDRV